MVARFAEDVMAGRWRGMGTIWIGPDKVGGEFAPFPAGFDHMRAIPARSETSELEPSRETVAS
jgi:hypothetical protein